MPATILDGRATAAKLTISVVEDAAAFAAKAGRLAKLAVLIVGEDKSQQMYVRRIVKTFQTNGMDAESIEL